MITTIQTQRKMDQYEIKEAEYEKQAKSILQDDLEIVNRRKTEAMHVGYWTAHYNLTEKILTLQAVRQKYDNLINYHKIPEEVSPLDAYIERNIRDKVYKYRYHSLTYQMGELEKELEKLSLDNFK